MYIKNKWYWFVAGDKSQVWSSAAAGFVPLTDAGYVAFLESFTTQVIGTLNEMLEIQIQIVEETITQRRMREAALGTDAGWLAAREASIEAFRARMTS